MSTIKTVGYLPVEKGKNRSEGETFEESLVPVIEEEERRLAAQLDAARTEAAKLVHSAEDAAAKEFDALKRRLPGMKEEKRARAMKLIESEAETLQKETSQSNVKLNGAVDAGVGGAVSKVISLVWPARS